MDSKRKHERTLQLAKLTLKEIEETVKDGDDNDIELRYEQTSGLIRKLELSVDCVKDSMSEEEKCLKRLQNGHSINRQN